MLEWVNGFAMGLCVGIIPTAFSIGAMYQQNLSARNRAEVVRELHKAVVDIGGRFSTWMKGKTNGETKLGAACPDNAGAVGAGVRHGVDDAGTQKARPASRGKQSASRKRVVGQAGQGDPKP